MNAYLLSCSIALFALPVWAVEPVRLPDTVASSFLQSQRGADGYEYRLKLPARKPRLPVCEQPLQAMWPPGEAMPYRGVLISCPAQGWSQRYEVEAIALPMVYVATRLLRAGEIVAAEDLRLQTVTPAQARLGERDAAQLLGRMVRTSLPAGTMLTGSQLRAPYVVKMNQPVRLQARGDGFVVGSDAIALGNASAGERVNVRVPSGRVISALVEADGSVSINVQ